MTTDTNTKPLVWTHNKSSQTNHCVIIERHELLRLLRHHGVIPEGVEVELRDGTQDHDDVIYGAMSLWWTDMRSQAMTTDTKRIMWKALDEIAAQSLESEMDEGWREHADYRGAYDCIVRIARAVLKKVAENDKD